MELKFLLLLLSSSSFLSAKKLVGTLYFTGHNPLTWYCSWGNPTDGKYLSDNRIVMHDHAEWLRDAGVDFIVVDWSKDIEYNDQNEWQGDPGPRTLEKNTLTLFEEFSKVKGAPKIAIMMGSPDNKDYYDNWSPFMTQKLD